MKSINEILNYRHHSLRQEPSIFDGCDESSKQQLVHKNGVLYIIGEFWTSKQRQASSIHEVSYRACFKPQLPNFFIDLYSEKGDVVYDPFSGRGTTAIEAALCGREVIANDINPLSKILASPRIMIPRYEEFEARLESIPYAKNRQAELDLSMFYHQDTLSEIVCLRDYLIERKASGKQDYVDNWIRMIATNKLSGHSTHFFSGYTLPPNQACSAEKQRELNEKHNRTPNYKNTKGIILKKSYELLKDINNQTREAMFAIGKRALWLNCDAADTKQIPAQSVNLVVTSPPFLDVIDYAADNWLRCWFNDIDIEVVKSRMVVTSKLEAWEEYMALVFKELYRVVNLGGHVAFEVGEVRGGRIKLEESVIPIGQKAGFKVLAVLINEQNFTKTSNIWGVSNNRKGVNTNRIVILKKET